MRTIALTFVFAAVLASSGASAQTYASANGLYLGLVGGAQFFDGVDAGDGTEIDFDTGYVVGGQLGYRFGQLRAEAELAYEVAELEDVDDDIFDTKVIRAAAGLYFDLLPVAALGGISPYAGGGIGVANIEIEGTDGNDFEDDETGFTFHGEAGVTIKITENLAIAPHYRFEWFDTKEVANFENDLYAHAVRVSGRFSF